MSEGQYQSNIIDGFIQRKLLFGIFNRATYCRIKSLLTYLERVKWLTCEAVIGSSLTHPAYGNAAEYVRRNHPWLKIYELPTHDDYSEKYGMALQSFDIVRSSMDVIAHTDYDACVAIADRYETLPFAMASKYLGKILIHIQGGEVTGNLDEIVRHSVSKLSDYHFVCTNLSKKYLIEMGEDSQRVSITGCPSISLIKSSFGGRKRTKEKYIICLYHPETGDDSETQIDKAKIVVDAVIEYCAKFGAHCYMYMPNCDPGNAAVRGVLRTAIKENPTLLWEKVNVEPEIFIRELGSCDFIIGNSSAGIREASYLGVPAINIGKRQSLRERACNVLDTDYKPEEINYLIKKAHEAWRYPRSYLYGDGRAHEYMVKALSKIPFAPKGCITYPKQARFRSEHFSETRFIEHRRFRRGISERNFAGAASAASQKE